MDGVPSDIGNVSGDSNAVAHHHANHQNSEHKYSGITAAERMDRERYYATVRKPTGQQQSPTPVAELERIPEYSEDIYPYATFHLPDQGNLPGRHSTSSNISHPHLPKFI